MLVGIVGYLLLKKIVPLEDLTHKEVIGYGMMITEIENGYHLTLMVMMMSIEELVKQYIILSLIMPQKVAHHYFVGNHACIILLHIITLQFQIYLTL
jgi:hypothetical protein